MPSKEQLAEFAEEVKQSAADKSLSKPTSGYFKSDLIKGLANEANKPTTAQFDLDLIESIIEETASQAVEDEPDASED